MFIRSTLRRPFERSEASGQETLQSLTRLGHQQKRRIPRILPQELAWNDGGSGLVDCPLQLVGEAGKAKAPRHPDYDLAASTT